MTTDLAILQAFDSKRRCAWAGFFNGGRSRMVVFEGQESRLFFGKAECELVPATFWTEELVDLGWLTVEDSEKRPALGMDDLPEGRKPWCWDRTFTLTERGWAVRESDLEDFRRVMDEHRMKRDCTAQSAEPAKEALAS